MINKLFTLKSDSLDPFLNQGIEKDLTDNIASGECILYLWRNHNTVVIGKNQDAFAECNVALLEREGGHLARRLSGGGAVYHDKGNLNYTFVVNKEDYDTKTQLSVIVKAMGLLGLKAYPSGRNDLLINEKKFSGTAYYKSNFGCMHHGTLLIEGSKDCMARYLSCNQHKLKRHAVSSVKSRVINLRELLPNLCDAELETALVSSFEAVYGCKSIRLSAPSGSPSREFFCNNDWRYGLGRNDAKRLGLDLSLGSVELLYSVLNNTMVNVLIHSDAMDYESIDGLQAALEGVELSQRAIFTALSKNEIQQEAARLLIKELHNV